MMMDELIILAQDIGNVVNQIPVKDRARTVEMGADGTPTAHIDKVAEKIILDYIESEQLPLNIQSVVCGLTCPYNLLGDRIFLSVVERKGEIILDVGSKPLGCVNIGAEFSP